MRRHLSTRLLATAALAIPLSAGTIALTAGAASASSKTTCSSLSGTVTGGSFTYGGCTSATTGGGGTSTGETSPSTINWSNGGTTTYKFTEKAVKGAPACAAGDSQFAVKGKVTKSTGAASKIKGAVKGTICYDPTTDSVSLPAGSLFTF